MIGSGKCWNCLSDLTQLDYGRQDTCRKCGKDTHVCRNCVFYDPSYNNQCRENQADRVVDKDRANFCDYLKPSQDPSNVGASKAKADLVSAAEALFKKK